VHIIILGGGGVGSTLATLLSNENQDVVIIEKDPDLARRLNEEIDGLVKCGNGASAVMLEEAGIKNAEMLIAVTEVDEVNMIACMLAKKYNVPITVARVRNPEYYEGSSILSNEQLGIDIIINPERVASFEIAKIIRTPNVRETEYFAKGQIKMVSIIIDEHTKLINQPLHKLPIPKNSIVAAIERKNGEFIVPGGNDMILPEDKVFLLGKRGVLDDISWLFQKKDSRNLNVLILGGGRIGFQLAELLEFNRKNNINVKIIEKDEDCCQIIAAKLNRTLILQGDATDLSFLKQEDIQNTDVLVAVTGDDRTNILASVLAKQSGVRKTICEVINQDYYSLFHNIGIEHIISPRLLTATQILRLIRKGEVVSMSLIEDGKMEILELNILPSAKVAHKTIQNAGIPKGVLIGAILRKEEEIIMPRGNDYLLPGDQVILFLSPNLNSQIDRLFAGNKQGFMETTNNI
jgi:trk system potassium uptake protein